VIAASAVAAPLVLYGVGLLAIAAALVWFAADRWWHYLFIAVGWMPLFPLVAARLTGDVSRYLPADAFSDGARGKDEIVIASAYATIVVAVALAAAALWILKLLWRMRAER